MTVSWQSGGRKGQIKARHKKFIHVKNLFPKIRKKFPQTTRFCELTY
jgi:hypothetical protein